MECDNCESYNETANVKIIWKHEEKQELIYHVEIANYNKQDEGIELDTIEVIGEVNSKDVNLSGLRRIHPLWFGGSKVGENVAKFLNEKEKMLWSKMNYRNSNMNINQFRQGYIVAIGDNLMLLEFPEINVEIKEKKETVVEFR